MIRLCLALSLSVAVRLLGFVTEPLLSNAEIHRPHGDISRGGTLEDLENPGRPEELEIITWNIQRGQEYDLIMPALRSLDADVLLLQEVDRYCRRTGYRDIAQELAEALAMNWVWAGEFQEIGEGRSGRPALTGQAILSRFPIEDAEVLRFEAQDRWRWSINPLQPRRGGRMALKARIAGMMVYNTHIESGPKLDLKRRQIEEIIEDHSRGEAAGLPVIIGGDFNNGPQLHASMFEELNSANFVDALGVTTNRGATSLGQQHPIDWIFVRNIASEGGRVVPTAHASDHFPVIAALGNAPVVAMTR
jgi:endonuclease/exonuclease/phosphatase family metal-dependent hydrolase